MLISEIIAKLEEFKAENGDIRTIVRNDYGDFMDITPFDWSVEIDEEADDDNEKVVVLY